MANAPRIVDVRDNLERAREESGGDVDEEPDAVEAQIAEFTDRTRADEEGVLDTVDIDTSETEDASSGAER